MVVFDALKGYNDAVFGQYKFFYNVTRLQTANLVNTQLSRENQISPAQLWPEFGEESDPESLDEIDPNTLEFIQKSIVLLNGNANEKS